MPVAEAVKEHPILMHARKLWQDHKTATADDWLTGYFALLWEETNGKGAWERNDWVWVVEFKAVT